MPTIKPNFNNRIDDRLYCVICLKTLRPTKASKKYGSAWNRQEHIKCHKEHQNLPIEYCIEIEKKNKEIIKEARIETEKGKKITPLKLKENKLKKNKDDKKPV